MHCILKETNDDLNLTVQKSVITVHVNVPTTSVQARIKNSLSADANDELMHLMLLNAVQKLKYLLCERHD